MDGDSLEKHFDPSNIFSINLASIEKQISNKYISAHGDRPIHGTTLDITSMNTFSTAHFNDFFNESRIKNGVI